MNNQSKEFKALQKLWDKKLAASGFQDIEQRDGGLKVWSDRFCNGYHNEITMSAKQEYYRAAGHFLHEYEFKTPTEKRIWTLHSEAMSIRNIVKALKKEKLWFVGGHTAHKRRVHETIQRFVKLMMEKVQKDNLSD